MSHSLDGPRLKVRRAKQQIDLLRGCEETFRGVARYRVVKGEIDPSNGHQVYRVLINVLPSSDWSLLIGEIAHNLRSALDNLTWQLALLNTKGPAGNTQFPIFLVGRTVKRRTKKPAKGRPPLRPHFVVEGRNMIRSLKPRHQAAIERLQPYHRDNGGTRNPLYQLNEINNADKHRLIHVAGAKAAAVSFGGWGDVDISQVRTRGLAKPLEDGAIVAHAPPDVHMNPRIVPLVAFWKGCEAVEGRGVCYTLSQIADQVGQIVESFEPEFRVPPVRRNWREWM